VGVEFNRPDFAAFAREVESDPWNSRYYVAGEACQDEFCDCQFWGWQEVEREIEAADAAYIADLVFWDRKDFEAEAARDWNAHGPIEEFEALYTRGDETASQMTERHFDLADREWYGRGPDKTRSARARRLSIRKANGRRAKVAGHWFAHATY
jgi:hypothetical protein